MRASESLALTSQADAAFLIRLAQVGLHELAGSTRVNLHQLKRSLRTIVEVAFRENDKDTIGVAVVA